jgi:hypothetical protein
MRDRACGDTRCFGDSSQLCTFEAMFGDRGDRCLGNGLAAFEMIDLFWHNDDYVKILRRVNG